jgi:hypothetical protein
MTHTFRLLTRGIAVLVFGVTITSAAAGAGTVYVSDVEQLYAAVDDPGNIGATVVLAPGVYSLSLNKPTGGPRDHLGRLELQKDMSLYGVAGDRAAVVIDATALPRSSFDFQPFGRTGIIRTGRGSNAVEWLTIDGPVDAAAGIETDLPPSGLEFRIRVAHVVAKYSARGVDIRNVGSAMVRRRIDAEIVDNDISFGVEGIRVANFQGADNGDISVVMSGNRSHANVLGCILENNRSSVATIHVVSSGDRFEDNGLGCQIGAGLVGTATRKADSNSTVFEGHGTHFTNNTRTTFFNNTGPAFKDFGGLLVIGGDALMLLQNDYTSSSNDVTVRLWGCKVAENQNIDFDALGARSADPSRPAGIDNHVTIELHGVSRKIEVVGDGSVPADPSGSNTVTVIR